MELRLDMISANSEPLNTWEPIVRPLLPSAKHPTWAGRFWRQLWRQQQKEPEQSAELKLCLSMEPLEDSDNMMPTRGGDEIQRVKDTARLDLASETVPPNHSFGFSKSST